VKQGVVQCRVTRVAQNTRYDQNVKNAYVSYINEQIKIGRYCPEDIVSMEETNFDFDQEAGETLANRGDRTSGQAVTGSANRCTVLLAVTMSGGKLPPYIIFKGKDARGSRVWKEFATTEAMTKFGYPEEAFYAVQPNAWMDEKRFLDWTERVWKPFIVRPAASAHGSYMIMDEFKVHLMSSCLNALQDIGTGVDFVVGRYTGCVQILDKGINRPFKGYARENFEHWMMTNNNQRHPTRGEVASWIDDAWNKISMICIKNTWRSVGHFVPGELGDPTITQECEDVASITIPVIIGVSHDDDGGEDSGDEDEGVKFQHEEETENEPLFRRGRHLRSNLLDIEDEEPLFVMKLTTEEIDRARRFPNGNGECDEDEDEDTGNITAL
jgi:hypothetical protein